MNQDISGGLDTTRCPEIVKILSLGKRSGKLSLSNGSQSGSIFFRDGEVIHAQCGALQGAKAIYELAVWTSGEYRFSVDEMPDAVTVELSVDEILAEATNRIRQMDRVISLIPSSTIVYALDPEIKEKEIVLKSIQWKILAQIDGKKTIADIAQNTGLGVSDTMKVFYTLVKSGLLREAYPSEAESPVDMVELPETPFIKALKDDLTRAIGPVAPFIITETAREMNLDLLADDVEQKAALIETLSSKIPSETMSLKFLDSMTDWINTEDI
ncbi:MAG: DUF4388 domain-containing protein [Desulfomonilia bacterium]|jgi:hypothetical protein|uniref:Uncharacterized protein n=1 Tax=anaerobic digester metagenome TaxID=1263854 RepID=A0A485LWL1_9ZZZZ|nr:DUF4388 domain-containing protein [Pseudomonadota bacterium]HON38759.1 DUF4388 domain-containing protein [Deltaproteobacteria bacterium]HRS56571.1 DUF4388 domain-containing protein [Desulfomonilia bacterium]HPD21921.1 DUF4388 domain-containing protein [Deltaproteobacteria bacterium]HPX18445.1 DUF4388 domain-containing protein [Deltaproteobacteria bacterium]